MVNTLAIDLDDTLFSEIDYVYSGYDRVARAIETIHGIPYAEVREQISYQFFKYGRSGVFDRILEHFEMVSMSVNELVGIYRNHTPDILLYPGVSEMLGELKCSFNIVIVTDGTYHVQKNKINALGLGDDMVIYCDEHKAPKPSVLSLNVAANSLGVRLNDMLFIGDDPYCDVSMANAAGIKSYRVKTGKYKSIECLTSFPDAEFPTFVDAAKHIVEHGIDD